MTVPIPVTPGLVAIDLIGKALGREVTQQEALDLAPVAVMVQAFIASAEPGDLLSFDNQQWDTHYLFGMYDSSGRRTEVRVEKGTKP